MRKPSASTGIPVGTRISNGHALARESMGVTHRTREQVVEKMAGRMREGRKWMASERIKQAELKEWMGGEESRDKRVVERCTLITYQTVVTPRGN